MDANLTRLGAKHITFHTDEVAQIEQFLEDDIIEIALQGIALHINLNAALRILDLGEGGLTHDTLAHDAAGNAHHTAVLRRGRFTNIIPLLILANDREINKIAYNIRTPGINGKFSCWIGLYAHVSQRFHILSANNLLFAQFKYFQIHIDDCFIFYYTISVQR